MWDFHGVGGRSMMMSLLAAFEQNSCVELACYRTVQFIFGTARWRTSWSIIYLFRLSVLTTSLGARGVFFPTRRVRPDPSVSLFGWINVRASPSVWDFPSGHKRDTRLAAANDSAGTLAWQLTGWLTDRGSFIFVFVMVCWMFAFPVYQSSYPLTSTTHGRVAPFYWSNVSVTWLCIRRGFYIVDDIGLLTELG